MNFFYLSQILHHIECHFILLHLVVTNCMSDHVSLQGAIRLISPIEKTYRARYKSDYFPQNNAPRKPRYIADLHGNHFLQIQVYRVYNHFRFFIGYFILFCSVCQIPEAYRADLSQRYLRIAIITTFIENEGYFYSPYKFQICNTRIEVPDENPTYMNMKDAYDESFIVKYVYTKFLG